MSNMTRLSLTFIYPRKRLGWSGRQPANLTRSNNEVRRKVRGVGPMNPISKYIGCGLINS